ncbi:MAG TPA: hypothetical protein VLE49_05680 [Anaerolineales bacterium]|nr:hypothetical protein [Anaerolineales bacterium]
MEIQYFLESLGFYLLPSLFIALIPTAIIISLTSNMKSSSNWKPIFLCLVAGIFMWCYMAYWSIQGFLIFPLGVDVPILFTNLFALIGGIVGGIVMYRGTINYQEKNRRLSSISLIGIGYFIFVFTAFSILNNRWVA